MLRFLLSLICLQLITHATSDHTNHMRFLPASWWSWWHIVCVMAAAAASEMHLQSQPRPESSTTATAEAAGMAERAAVNTAGAIFFACSTRASFSHDRSTSIKAAPAAACFRAGAVSVREPTPLSPCKQTTITHNTAHGRGGRSACLRKRAEAARASCNTLTTRRRLTRGRSGCSCFPAKAGACCGADNDY